MHVFQVWAPRPIDVALEVDGRRVAMERDGGGWWRCSVDDAGSGSRYGYSLDGGPVRPDPRAPSLPDGVHGLAEVVDHATFPWSDRQWHGRPLAGMVLYEAHVGTFSPSGTFAGMIERLPHLVELGIDAVELMPLNSFPGERGWGYDGVGWYAPHQPYGGVDGLRELVDACHAAGLAVVVDVVYNHLGPSGNYLPEFGPYLSDRYRTVWGGAVNFDGPGSDEVRAFVVDNACMWLRDFHVDGLRLDAVHAIVDESPVHILEELSGQVRALSSFVGRPLFVVAESDRNDPRLVRPNLAGGYGLDAVWADDWHHAVHAALSGEREGYYEDFGSAADLAKALRQAWVYDGVWSRHRQRRHGASPAGLLGRHFVVATQNHDQVGNRAGGDRLSSRVGVGGLKVAAALSLTSPFTPLLFQGEEWAASTPFQYFTDHLEPELAEAVRHGRRQEFAAFGWDPAEVPDPQEPSTFERSKLDWDEIRHGAHAEMYAWYSALLRLRRARPELHDDRLHEVRTVCADQLVVVDRPGLMVVANLAAGPIDLTWQSVGELLLGSHEAISLTSRAHAGASRISLPAESVAVIGYDRALRTAALPHLPQPCTEDR